MHSLQWDFLKVTELAALSVLPFVGTGDKKEADRIATNTMRKVLNEMNIDGTIVIGEGEIDEAPMLYIGEKVGKGKLIKVDIAVDPIEGTTSTVNGQNNALTVIAAAPQGKLLHAPDMYMEKLAVGSNAKGKINLNASIQENLEEVAKANNKKVNELNVVIQDRPRHNELIDSLRAAGAKVHLFKDGDIIYTIATCLNELSVDMFIGIGGAPEGVIGAVALKALGGEMQGRLLPKNKTEVVRCKEMGLDNPKQLLTHDDLVNGNDCIFVATGITDSILAEGIKINSGHYLTHTLMISGKDQKLQYIISEHLNTKV